MMGMMLPGAGGKGGPLSPALPVAEDLKELIAEEEQRSTVRAIAVSIDKKRPRLLLQDSMPAGSSFDEDFGQVDWETWLDDGAASIVLLRTSDEVGSIQGAQPNTFLFLLWMPEGVPVRQKMNFSSALISLRSAAEGIEFKEWNVTERSEVTLEEAHSIGRELTEQERFDGMTLEEQARAEFDNQVAEAMQKQDSTKRRMALLQASFEDALEKVMGGSGQALLATLGSCPDDDTVEINGEVMDGISLTPQLQGRLPQDSIAFALVKGSPEELLLVFWAPAGASEADKAKGQSVVRSVKHSIQEKIGESFSLYLGEAFGEADLTEDLGFD